MNLLYSEMKHEDGTKFYTTMLLSSEASENSFLITNYGKIGAAGRVEVASRINFNVGYRDYINTVVKKQKRGYESVHDQKLEVSNDKIPSILEKLAITSVPVVEAMAYFGITVKSAASSAKEAQRLTPTQVKRAKKEQQFAALPAGWGDW